MTRGHIDKNNWRDYKDIASSLWIIDRDSDKAENKFQGAFCYQVAENLIYRYTTKGDWCHDFFGGTGTTERVCIDTGRNSCLLDLNFKGNSKKILKNSCHFRIKKNVLSKEFPLLPKAQLTILHPPYLNIIKFSDTPGDMSNMDYLTFMVAMRKVFLRAYENTDKHGHIALVFGDTFQNGVLIPASRVASIMDNIIPLADLRLPLRAKFIKNITGNERGKGKNNNLWKYRALINGLSVFSHEEIYIWRKIK